MRILIDMDDTIENLGEAWVHLLNKKYGTEVNWLDIRKWDMQLSFPTLTEKQIYEVLNEESLWDTVTVKEGAAARIQELMEQGHEVFIVTSSWYTTIVPKVERCLFKYLPFLSWHQVIVTSHKYLIKGDILVDDNPENFVNGDYFGILFNAPHNTDFDESSRDLVRADNWDSVYIIIQSYQKLLELLS